MRDTIKLNCPNKPKMIAHRGVSKLEKENTAAAFIAAGNRSYYGIETDIRKTADGVFVCLHDANVSRVGIDDINVEKSTYDTVRKIQLCGISGEKDRNGICIPTLQEYIQICKHYEKAAIVELKRTFSKDQLTEIYNIIREADWLDQTIFLLFGLDIYSGTILENLFLLREIDPGIKAQYLLSPTYFKDGGTAQSLADELVRYNLDLDIDYEILTPEIAKAVHDAGKTINVWEIDDVESALRIINDCHVEYITSNILE